MTSTPHAPTSQDGELLSTGDMARLTGNTLRTVRFYEEAGLLKAERRSSGGHRMFGRSDLDRLQLISDLRAAGLSLEEIRELLELKQASNSAKSASSAVVDAVERQIAVLDHKLSVLTRLRAELAGARHMLGDCRACTDHGFPDACDGCEKLAARGELPASMRVLWSVRGG
jgi:DNA-binding transcriptional MerR regulator